MPRTPHCRTRVFHADMQKRPDTRRIPIAKVGVKDITYPIVVMDKNRHPAAYGREDQHVYVDLPHHFKGTHMSRFVEILNKYREQIALDKLETILEEMKAKLGSESAHLEISSPTLSTRPHRFPEPRA